MRYFLELSYRGDCYNGWQRQRNAPSVQQRLEDALSTLLGAPAQVTGAGRTDTGVHAAYYVAHFDCASNLDTDGERFLYRLNALLPDDIAVLGVTRVADDAHARFDAVRREYKYYIRNRKNPFTRAVEWQYYVPLDVEAMNAAAVMLPECADFTTFSKLHSGNRTNICRVFDSHWEQAGSDSAAPARTGCSAAGDTLLIYTVAADRFLRNMVRSLVAAMVDVGRGRITVERFGEILSSRDRSLSTATAPACGLFLTDVAYPQDVMVCEPLLRPLLSTRRGSGDSERCG
jgi:tRNA pseudouridine38-40 synthase